MNKPTTRQMLVQGLTDAAGFLGGASVGMWLGKSLGFSAFMPGFSSDAIFGIILVVVSGGLGVQLARHWLAGRIRNQNNSPDKKDT